MGTVGKCGGRGGEAPAEPLRRQLGRSLALPLNAFLLNAFPLNAFLLNALPVNAFPPLALASGSWIRAQEIQS